MIKKRVALIILLISCFSSVFSSEKYIKNLRVNYEVNPLGIEETPVFSWEMESMTYNASQTAYRIVVSDNKDNLNKGVYVFDSGKIKSGSSVCIPYQGNELKPCTRYFWRVTVWDENNNSFVSADEAWFETALLDSGWNNALWIGSEKSTLSKYTGKADIHYDFTIKKGSNNASFLFGYRGKDNYVNLNIDATQTDKVKLILSYRYKGRETVKLIQPLNDIIKPDAVNRRHHVKITMISLNHFNGYYLNIYVDGVNINTLDSYPFKKKSDLELIIEKANTGYKYARLYGIGFLQEQGQNAVFENIEIYEPFFKQTMYLSEKIYDIEGTGKPVTWVPNNKVAAPMLRKTFRVNKTIKQARLYATSRGIYEMSINGKDVCKDFFNPGWSDYRFRLTYNTFDVTDLIKMGNNAIGAILGTGYYTGPWGYHAVWNNGYGVDINLRAKLLLIYEDGSSEVVVTDGSWTCYDNGPIMENSLHNGVDYDARKEPEGWNTPAYDDKSWKRVKIYPDLDKEVKLQAYIGQPVRAEHICTAQKMTEPIAGHYIYDMGQNMVGIPRLVLHGKRGQRIKVRYAEMLYPDIIPTEPVAPYTIDMYKKMKGQMYIDNYRGALSTDNYICHGKTQGEVFEPRFTSHGFRYIEITGVDKPLELDDVKVMVLNSTAEVTASYETDDVIINKLYNNIVWGQKGNFLAVPTDCPQRDERLGWTGDAQIFTRTATYNRNVQPFFNRWLYTLRDDQSAKGGFPRFAPLSLTIVNDYYNNAAPGWADVGIITPWEIYLQYGDKTILEKSYESMKRYMDYLKSQAKDDIQPIGGYGDWVALLGTPSDLTNTAYSALDARIMTKVAKILGRTTDAEYYGERFEKIKRAFCNRFLGKDGYMIMPKGSPAQRDSYSAAYGTGPKTTKDTILDSQTGYILPLYAGLIDDSVKDKAVKHLVDLLKQNGYKLNTGFIGTPYMNIVLSDNGYDDVAYKMFQQKEYPSWCYPVYQGATTIWERWNSYTLVNGFGPVDMNSFNHYSYGAIEDWMMAYGAGIQRDEDKPGYKHIILQPRIGGTLGYTSAKFHTVYGEVASAWRSIKPDKNADAADYGYTYEATVPANTTATLTLPLHKGKIEVMEGRKGIKSYRQSEGKMMYEIGSGKYIFRVR